MAQTVSRLGSALLRCLATSRFFQSTVLGDEEKFKQYINPYNPYSFHFLFHYPNITPI